MICGEATNKRTNQAPVGNVWRRLGLPLVLAVTAAAACSPMVSLADDSCDSFLSCCDEGGSCRQFYLGGIVGADFATVDKTSTGTSIPNDSLFTAGGTAGMRFLRENGAYRLEFEGRGRDQASLTDGDPAGDSLTLRATDGWSAMVNIWRDYKPYESFGLYAGGGIGAGGYRSTFSGTGIGSLITGNDRVSNFAWQAGGGIFYEISKRATIDLGYRFFSISESTATYEFIGIPVDYQTNFAASELLLSVRIYEPFRGWRR